MTFFDQFYIDGFKNSCLHNKSNQIFETFVFLPCVIDVIWKWYLKEHKGEKHTNHTIGTWVNGGFGGGDDEEEDAKDRRPTVGGQQNKGQFSGGYSNVKWEGGRGGHRGGHRGGYNKGYK